MRVKRLRSRGAMMVIAIGMMVLVSMMTVNQLQTLKINMDGRSRIDQAKMADIAARSGMEYGYSMLKNLMDSMSLIHLRFATHYYGDGTNQLIADIPPSWQEIINIHFDRKAAQATVGVPLADGSSSDMGDWVGTDSHFTHYHESPEEDPSPSAALSADTGNSIPKPFDYAVAMEGANAEVGLRTILTATGAVNSSNSHLATTKAPRMGYWALDNNAHTRLRECAREEVQYASGTRIGLLYPEAAYSDPGQINTQCHYLNIWERLNVTSPPAHADAVSAAKVAPWTVVPSGPMTSFDGTNNYYLDGHFGTKRWHYFDAFDFPAITGPAASEFSINASRSTGGSISTTRADFPLDNSPGLGTFLNFRDILFERLVNYRYDTTVSRYPHEPKDYTQTSDDLAEASANSYNVQMFTALDLDFERPTLGVTEDEELYNHTDYDNVRHKIFFKLWITRDENKDGYNSEAFTPPATWPPKNHPLDTDIKYYSYKGTVADGPASDLHPVWMVPRDSGNITGYSGTPVAVDDTSYWKPDFLNDFLDTNRNGSTTDLLGVLQFPVPYLALQRGDYDIFPNTIMGQPNLTNPPTRKDEYTKFTLWSLGTVKEISPNVYTNRSLAVGSSLLLPESQQRISDFQTVARVLYKMDFFIDIRAVDVHSQNDYIDFGQDLDGAEANPNSIISTDGSCSGTPAKNRSNQAYYNSRFIPICDVDNRSPLGAPARSKFKHFEPLGIVAMAMERVPYVDSKRP